MLSAPDRTAGLVRRTDVHLEPDPSRVVTQLFVAGEELSSGASRASPVMQRVLAMSDLQVERLLAETLARFENRHPHLRADLLEHFNQIGHRLGTSLDLSVDRRLLLGAYATNECSVEGAALCNPSIVAHPNQEGLDPGELRFVLSLRAVGEGHVSSIEFRTGISGPGDRFALDDPGKLLTSGQLGSSRHELGTFRSLLDRHGHDDELVALVFDRLPAAFDGAELEASIARLPSQVHARSDTRETIDRIRAIARSNYTVDFPDDSSLGQRVIRPRGPSERNGMEDARFVRFVDDDGAATYYATYTAFDGAQVTPQLLQTDDFQTFSVAQLTGPAARNKGMAIFPRRIGGRFVALSRWDRERNAVTFSLDARQWETPHQIQAPEQPWELINIGNCGSPIETAEGWLVFTHGVGPMRTYSIGALLLDLDDPTTVRGKLAVPLLEPNAHEREGYVPNVVYTCGAMVHGQTVLLPYAHGDRETTLALIALPDLVDLLCM